MMPQRQAARLRRSTWMSLLFILFFSLLSLVNISRNINTIEPVLAEQLASFIQAKKPTLLTSRRSSSSSNTTAPKNSFSACLLTMDDNHFLIEWLAYHYHTLPLRYLIVAVDSKSKTSPSFIFDRWRNHEMVIEEWSDRDFFNKTEKDITRKKFPKFSKATNLHRLRQTTFYEKCLSSLQKQGRSWTILIDTDEYLAYNTHTEQHLNATVETPATFLSFLQRELQKNETKFRTRFQQPPCIMIPRLRYGSKESLSWQVHKDVPNHNFNASAFITLQWRKHAPLNNIKINRVTKAILDVSQIPQDDMVIENLHHPTKYCSERLVTMKIRDSYLVVRHYLGTWEQFSFRNDVRKVDGMRGEKTFSEYQNMDNGDDDGVRPWLKGFVAEMGSVTAAELLKGVGDVSVAA